MDMGLLRGGLAAHHAPSVLPVDDHASENPEPSDDPKPFSVGTRRRLWIVLLLDVVTVPWMLAIGSWLDKTSKLTSVVTLAGHHQLVLILAIVGFVMLSGLALWTDWFMVTRLLDRALVIVACVISIIALAGALSVIVLLAAAWIVLGFGLLIKK